MLNRWSPDPCRWVVPFALALGLFAARAPTQACTTDGLPRLFLPRPASADVPTDVELLVTGELNYGTTVQLVAEGSDAEVPLVRVDPPPAPIGYVTHLRPTVLLRPNTPYALIFTYGAPTLRTVAYSFRTGDGPSTAPLPAASVRGAQAVDNFIRSSCGGSNVACLSLDEASTWEVVVRRKCDGVELERQYFTDPTRDLLVAYTPRFTSGPLCFDVRARDLAGRYGPRVSVCPDPAEVAIASFGSSSTCEITCAAGRVRMNGREVQRPPDDLSDPACVPRFLGIADEGRYRAEFHAIARDAGACAVTAPDVSAPAPDASADVASAPDADASVSPDAERAHPSIDSGGCAVGPRRASSPSALLGCVALSWLVRRRSRRVGAGRCRLHARRDV